MKHRDAEELEILFRPLVEQWGYIHADKTTNRLILVTTLGSAERLHRLVKELDTKEESNKNRRVYRLQRYSILNLPSRVLDTRQYLDCLC